MKRSKKASMKKAHSAYQWAKKMIRLNIAKELRRGNTR